MSGETKARRCKVARTKRFNLKFIFPNDVAVEIFLNEDRERPTSENFDNALKLLTHARDAWRKHEEEAAS